MHTKSLTLCVTRFFMEFLKLAEGGHFYEQKTMHLPLSFYIQKAIHFASHFHMQKMHFPSRFYIYLIYLIVYSDT